MFRVRGVLGGRGSEVIGFEVIGDSEGKGVVVTGVFEEGEVEVIIVIGNFKVKVITVEVIGDLKIYVLFEVLGVKNIEIIGVEVAGILGWGLLE